MEKGVTFWCSIEFRHYAQVHAQTLAHVQDYGMWMDYGKQTDYGMHGYGMRMTCRRAESAQVLSPAPADEWERLFAADVRGLVAEALTHMCGDSCFK